MRTLTDNLGWKLLALTASVLLWFWLIGETEVAASVPVIVQYRNVPPDLEITSEPENRLFLKLRGPATRLDAATFSAAALRIDLANVHAPGEQTFTVDARALGLPAGVELLRAVPSQVRVRLDRRGGKTVPVDIRYSGPPPSGYRIGRQAVTPDHVRVVGPATELAQLERASTDAIDLSSTVGGAEFRVPLYLENPHLRLDSSPSYAVVRVTLEKIPQ
jgi:YbbR domain-containing protein